MFRLLFFSHFFLFLGTVVLIGLESCIVQHDLVRYAGCESNTTFLGYVQTDQVYHGLFLSSILYQYFLFLESQKDRFYLLACLLFSLILVVFKVILSLQHFLFEQAGCFDPSQSIEIPSRTLAYASLGVEIFLFGVIFVTCVRLRPEMARMERDQRRTVLGWGYLSGLLKVDGYLMCVYCVQLLPAAWLGYSHVWHWEGLFMLGLSCLIYLGTLKGIQKEQGWVLLGHIGFQFLRLVYLGYRTYVSVVPQRPDPYELTRYSLVFNQITLIILGCLCLSLSIECVKNTMYYHIKLLSPCPHCHFEK